jgi:predicted O-linked N-acetylglucosamine transferase (SPINDLY family)
VTVSKKHKKNPVTKRPPLARPKSALPAEPVQDLLQSAIAHHQAGRSPEAETLYQRILEIDPNHADALHLLGILFHQAGKFAAAKGLFQRAIARCPKVPGYYNSLGNTLNCLKEHSEAEECFAKALALQPDLAEACHNLGYMYGVQKKHTAAEELFRRAIKARPGYADAHYELANVLTVLGRLDEAVASFREAIRLKPGRIEPYNNLGLVLVWQGKTQEAEQTFRKILSIKPDHALGYDNLGGTLVTQGRYQEALQAFQEALRLDPRSFEAENDLGTVLEAIGDLEESTRCFRRALEYRPSLVEAYSNLLFGLNYQPELTPQDLLAEHKAWADKYATRFISHQPPHSNSRDPDRRLRIGYVSPDFRTHSVAYFAEPILSAHNRSAFELFCYSDVASPDAVTKRIEGYTDGWRKVFGVPDEVLAERVREDRIDILVDLAGHTGRNRLFVFARKPAPVQIAYIGYPNTTGLPAMDYRITDAWADPVGPADLIHTEKLIRLPNGFNCYQPPANTSPAGPLPVLTTGQITFGSFNNFAKLNSQVIAVWAEILKQVPRSRLLIKCKQMGDPFVRERFFRRFEEQGIASDRFMNMAHIPHTAGHLDAYHLVDIGLDPFPFNGATTTCEALWMGVPVIALAGNRHASRVGVSLLSRLGLPDLVTATPAEYVERAVALAGKTEDLKDLRAGMRDRMMKSGLTDARLVTTSLEEAFRSLWQQWCQDQA